MSSRPRAEAILRAQLERAAPIAALRQRGNPHLTRNIEFAHALHRLRAVAKRIALSRGSQFRIGQAADFERLEPTALGRELLDLLLKIVPVIQPLQATMNLHPRLEGLVSAASSGADWSDPWRLDMAMTMNPRWWEGFLCSIVENVRREAASRAFLALETQHEDERKVFHRTLTSRFKAMLPTARPWNVVRLELSTPPEPMTLPWQSQDCGKLQRRLAAWLTDATRNFGATIATWAWKVDFNPEDGFLAHVILLLATDAEDRAVEVEQSVMSLWRSVTGIGGQAFACGDVVQPIEYRGSPHASWDDSVQDQLADAALYFAWADTNLFVRADPHQRLHGCADMPGGRRAQSTSPFPRWR